MKLVHCVRKVHVLANAVIVNQMYLTVYRWNILTALTKQGGLKREIN